MKYSVFWVKSCQAEILHPAKLSFKYKLEMNVFPEVLRMLSPFWWVQICTCPDMSTKQCLIVVTFYLWHLQSFGSSSLVFSERWEEEKMWLGEMSHFKMNTPQPLNLNSCVVSVSTDILFFLNKLLWWRLKNAPIYMYNGKSVKISSQVQSQHGVRRKAGSLVAAGLGTASLL